MFIYFIGILQHIIKNYLFNSTYIKNIGKMISNIAPTTVITEFCCSLASCSSSIVLADAEGTAVAVLLILAYFSSREVRTLRGVFSVLDDRCTPLSSSSRLIISLKSASKLSGVWQRNRGLQKSVGLPRAVCVFSFNKLYTEKGPKDTHDLLKTDMILVLFCFQKSVSFQKLC